MKLLRSTVVVVAVVAAFVSVGGSCGPSTVEQCTADSQCDVNGLGFNVCNVESGLCQCTDDRGCGVGEICNSIGACQLDSGCSDNSECNTGLFCDVVQAQCLAVDVCNPAAGEKCCVLDSQCGFNNVCDLLSGKCIEGCRDVADCILGQACVRGVGQALGQCAAGVCDGDNLCAFGEVCSSDGACVKDTRGPYCLGCAGGVQSDDCGAAGNFCLTDTVNGGEFCGVTSINGEACPFGYTSNDVIIVTNDFCSAETCNIAPGATSGTCTRNTSVRCSTDADCPVGFPGGSCARADIGNCRQNAQTACDVDGDCPAGDECLKQECRFDEGDNIGVCTCTRASDCPNDRCVDKNPTTGRGNCELSGQNCFTDDECAAVISCIDGGCFIGRNCAPADGRTCRELLPAAP
ncbi:MAG TPA: hypothetical protein VGF99_01480 [Myxococcota bacterium]